LTNRPADPEVALAINMTNLCRELHVLPRAGGLMDQDSYHVYLIQETLAVLQEKERKEVEAEKSRARAKRRH
jgi:hypothetical protein